MQKLLSRKVFKIEKSDNAGLGYLTSMMFLAPYKLSGKNFCPHASKGCAAACLFTSGHGRYPRIQQARIKRSRFFIENRPSFLLQLSDEIASFALYCHRRDVKAAVRLNGTSDLAWENIAPSLFTDYPMVQFYDYTKSHNRMLKFTAGDMPENYNLTFSRSETNHDKCLDVLSRGGNVAVVFKNPQKSWYGYPVFNADDTDLRFLDPFGVGALTPKGRARRDTSGFVYSRS